MGRVELTFEQVLEAARQLPAAQQKSLVQALTTRPNPDEVLKIARRLRPAFRLSPKKRRRMTHLAAKRSAGTLSASEKRELDDLVDEVTDNTLKMAEAVAVEVETATQERRSANGMSKR